MQGLSGAGRRDLCGRFVQRDLGANFRMPRICVRRDRPLIKWGRRRRPTHARSENRLIFIEFTQQKTGLLGPVFFCLGMTFRDLIDPRS